MEEKSESKLEDKLAIDKQAYALHVLQRFDEFQQKDEHCDFKVKVDSEEIPVHRNVLTVGSDYFNAMLSHDTLENQSGVVEIKEADAGCVRKCIDFMYNRDVAITLDECCDLMQIAHLLQLHQLFDAAAVYYGDRLDQKTFFNAKKLADLYESKVLGRKSDLYAFHNFDVISQMDDFMQLKVEYISHLIQSKENLASEAQKCDALIRWVKFDSQNRQKFLLENLKHLSLLSIPLKYRRFLLEREPLIYDDAKRLKLVTTSVFDNMNIAAEEAGGLVTKPSSIVAFNKSSKSVDRFDLMKSAWYKIGDTPSIYNDSNSPCTTTGIYGATSSCTSTGIYSAVALNSQLYTLVQNRQVHRLDYSTKPAKWQRVADMLMDHGQCPPSTVLHECIYVVGSYSKSSTSVEKYYPLTNKWTKMTDKTISCYQSTTVSMGQYIYSIGGCIEVWASHFGGYNEVHPIKEVERCDSLSITWEKVAPMKIARNGAAATGLQGKIYVCGGRSPSLSSRLIIPVADCEYYNPCDNMWTSFASMGRTRCSFRAVTIQQQIYVVGGRDSCEDYIEAYDAEKDKWEEVCSLRGKELEPLTAVAI